MVKVENRHNYDGPGTYIGRGTMWGNQASHKDYPGVKVKVNTREEAVRWYLSWLREQYRYNLTIHNALDEWARQHRRGKEIVLICSCAPQACHGDIIKLAIEKLAEAL
ncbi:MAG TPA: DUF4326 domain-containing protein [Bellilinea sp.]|nr:DUF4326 domain-containing protein [Bellilinea sp.]